MAGGADGSEIDVRRTADGQLVCVHDPLIGRRPVIEQSMAELAAAGVYAFADVVAAATGGRLVIEVKNDARQPDFDAHGLSARLVLEALTHLIGPPAAATQDVLISSFDPVSLNVARDGGRLTGLLTAPGVPLARGLDQARAGGYQELHAHVSIIARAQSVKAVQQAGLRLIAWTVTRDRQARRLAKLGVDGVICDDPVGVVAALADPS